MIRALRNFAKENMLGLCMLFSITAFSCEEKTIFDQGKDGIPIDVETYHDLEFIYQVTDKKGTPTALFKKGEDFVLNFIIKNQGERDVLLGRWDYIPAMDNFFAVYKKDIGNNGMILVGKPYQSGVNLRDLMPQIVPGNGKIKYQIPWLTEHNINYIMPTYEPSRKALDRNYISTEPTPLEVGQYYSGFTLQYKDKAIKLEISFSVE